ncbi:MAG: ribose-phosphate diphosphokinase [Nitrososphaerota archaeon]
MKIVTGPASRNIAQEVATHLGAELVIPYYKQFPDGEHYFRLPEIDPDDEFVIIQGTHPPQDKNIVQLLLLTSGLRQLQVRKVKAVIPYLAYARQDKAFLRGEVVSFSAILKLMKEAGLDELVTINAHAPWALEKAPMKTANLDAIPEIMSFIGKDCGKIEIVFSPGKKGQEMSKVAANILGAEHFSVTSRRDSLTGDVSIDLGDARVSGKNVAIIDDIISTGSTMIQVIKELKRRGALRVIAACVHGLFISNADNQIISAGAERIITTDTIPTPHSYVKVSKLISEYLKNSKG